MLCHDDKFMSDVEYKSKADSLHTEVRLVKAGCKNPTVNEAGDRRGGRHVCYAAM